MPHPAFTLIRQARIASLHIEVQEYLHRVTGARHLHLKADDNNNAFLIGFLTLPQNSKGVAHILEHTTLCGSKRYPVRDPFFMMIRRSLNTFMNAFTSSDWTAYPFASQNTKDFENLLKVYLDAVFFPRLTALDFAQEGHRIEFENPNDTNSPLVYKGIVYNEMKGAMSSPISLLWQTIQKHLFPTTTYHYNSGGEPTEIPTLTHAELKAFHATHYHPSNAVLMTYGDQDPEQYHSIFEEYALKHFQALPSQILKRLKISDEERYHEPQKITSYYPHDTHQETKNKTHIVISWLLGRSNDLREMMNAGLLAGVLLNNSACPLLHALESTQLGTAPSPVCGFDEESHEAVFTCGLEGSNPEQADEVEALIFKVLEDVAQNGIPQEMIDSVLHQIELNQREISGGKIPYGLRLLIGALAPSLHGADPIAFLDIDLALAALRADCQLPNFIPNLVKRLLLNNPHRVRIVMIPDETLADKQIAEEKARLDALKAKMTEEDKAKIIEKTRALEEHQKRVDDENILPKVGIEDIPPDLSIPRSTQKPILNMPATWFGRGTNGMVYESIVLNLPELSPELFDLLPTFCDCITEVGCGKKNYLETAAWQASISGGVNAEISLRGDVADTQKVRGFFTLTGKALARNHAPLADLLRKTLEEVHFSELPRLRELIAQSRADSDNHITARGHHLTMAACTSGMNSAGFLNHQWNGLAGLQTLRALDDELQNDDALAVFADKLTQIRNSLLTAPRQLLIVSEDEQQDSITESLKTCWQNADTPSPLFTQHHFPPFESKRIQQAWSIQTQVNFCSKAFPTVPMKHPDSAALIILGTFLRNGYLHSAIREKGGAYGSGSHYDGDTGSFIFFSFRDPRLIETLNDFDRSLLWFLEKDHQFSALEESILEVISKIDKPNSPAAESISTFFNSLHGRTPEHRIQLRQRILQVTIADLQRVVQTYFNPTHASTAVLSDSKTLSQLPDLLLERRVL